MTGRLYQFTVGARRALAVGTLAAGALALAPAITGATAPIAASNGLSGTWQVSRTCVVGCTGSTTLTETVRPFQGTVFMATGTALMVLYRLGKKRVLVHSATSSSLLSIRAPGQLMRGTGVGQDGSTFTLVWHCTAPPGAEAATRVWRADGHSLPALHTSRGIC
jgi:hypothetical protein